MKDLKFSFQLTNASPMYVISRSLNVSGYQLLGVNIEAGYTLEQIIDLFYDEFEMWCEEFKNLPSEDKAVYKRQIKEAIKQGLSHVNWVVPEWDMLPYLYFFGALRWEETQPTTTEVEPTLSFEVLDICYPDNLTNHCNGEREQLISCSWFEGIELEQVAQDLCTCAEHTEGKFWEVLPKNIPSAKLALYGVILNGIQDLNTDMGEVDEPEEMYIYGRLSW